MGIVKFLSAKQKTSKEQPIRQKQEKW